MGNVMFPGLTDVRGLDLDRIIEFSENSFSMFHQLKAPPPYGKYLNKQFVLTLFLDKVGRRTQERSLYETYSHLA